MGNNRRRRISATATRPTRTPATIESLSDELLRLTSHRDDGIAVDAQALHAELIALGPTPSAQQFERVYRLIFNARLALPEADLRAWRGAHGIARAVFVKLVRLHKINVERRKASR
jgi:hypothetical protein